ncbi:hypothetical protein DMC47_43425 [Nostoc sp. 3335mG]|nr:hypothetical protein DMC47_43425 [Nostoc sp. 3335mG]
MALPVFSRRALLGMMASLPAIGRAGSQRGLAAAATGVNPALVGRALDALARHNELVWSRDVIAIADFGLPSATPRFHLVDILTGTTTSLRVTHGRGSDPDHTGMLQSFSDVVGSAATSEGAYLTGQAYTGVHGLSRRLIGLDPTNAHAEERAIVIHSAWYADASILPQQGKLGRSDGCFAVSPADIATVLAMLGEGRLLYAGRASA